MKKIVFLGLFTLLTFGVFAQQTVRLYSGKAPGSEQWDWAEKSIKMPQSTMAYNVVDPEIIIYQVPKEKASGAALIVAPGGAFHILSMDSEGHQVAKWLNEQGITAIVLKYRLVRSLTDNPFAELMPLMSDFKKLDEINAPVVEMAKNDGIAAMKYVKKHAKDWGVDPFKIGFMGFSAGGTVTMSVMMSAPQDLKPNFIAPIYLYNQAVVGTEMPDHSTPIFIAVASDDQLKFVPQSMGLYSKWMEKHPAELHIYEKGGHGFGMNKQQTSSDHWVSDFRNWLTIRGYTKLP